VRRIYKNCLVLQATVQGFLSRGFSQDESEELLRKSVELAIEARDIYLKKCPQKRQILIAASVGSYGAYLADGSEYRYILIHA
jgi:homocysteine S-methyltransferase